MEQIIQDLFLDLLNFSISATWLISAVVLLRFLFKKMPKWVNCLLWGIVGIRLVFPFSVESIFSLVPSAETVPPEIVYSSEPQINSGIPALNSAVNPVITETFAPDPVTSVNPLQVVAILSSYLWAVGLVLMVLYAVISFLKLKHKMRTATLFRENIFQSENVQSPFVLGFFRPKIYLPYNMKPREMFLVVSHEKAHIKRKDHFIKPLAYLVLCAYWFNPAVWLAYILLCRDIEMACDEKVVREMDSDSRKDYSEALLNCSVNRRSIAACPLAFGEVGVKDRIKGVMNYKKPAFWVIILAAVLCVVTAVCFLTNPPQEKEDELFGATYEGEMIYTLPSLSSGTVDMGICEISTDGELSIRYEGETTYIGNLKESDYTREKLYEGIYEDKRGSVEIGEIIKAYDVDNEENKNVFFTTNEGEIYRVVLREDEKVFGLFKLEEYVSFENKLQNLETAIGDAVIENNKDSYYIVNAIQNKQEFDIALSLESHEIVHIVKDEEEKTLTAYVQTLYEEYIKSDGVVTKVAAGASPAKIEFDIVAEGAYELKSYFAPPPGEAYPEDMEKAFSLNPDYDDAAVMMNLKRECYERAVERLGDFGDYQNAWIAYRYICMSSSLSFVPSEYARHYRFNFDGETLSVTDGSGDLQNGEEIVYENKYSDIATYLQEDMEKLLINNADTVWARTDTKDMLNEDFTVYTFSDENGETAYTLLCENRTNVRFFITGDLEGIFRLYEAVDKNLYVNMY